MTSKLRKPPFWKRKPNQPVLDTEAGLLSAIKSAGKEIKNKDECKALQNVGIGTPATRAAIIETLFAYNYIQLEKKFLTGHSLSAKMVKFDPYSQTLNVR